MPLVASCFIPFPVSAGHCSARAFNQKINNALNIKVISIYSILTKTATLAKKFNFRSRNLGRH